MEKKTLTKILEYPGKIMLESISKIIEKTKRKKIKNGKN